MSRAMPDATAPVNRTRAQLAAAFLALLATSSVALEARTWLRSPVEAEYAAAAAHVRAAWQPGDAFTVAPAWALRPLEHLGDLPSVGVTAARAGLVFATARLWVVADPAADPDLHLLESWFREEDRVSFGPLRVVRYRVADVPAWGATASITTARVRLFKARGPAEGTACDVKSGDRGWLCPGEPDWLRTTAEWMDLGGVPSGGDRALWMHPPSRGDRRQVTFPGVALGRVLRVGGSHTEYGARSARAPVRVKVRVDGQDLVDRAFDRNHGWTTVQVDVPAELRSTPRDVVVTVETDDNAANHFALELGVVP